MTKKNIILLFYFVFVSLIANGLYGNNSNVASNLARINYVLNPGGTSYRIEHAYIKDGGGAFDYSDPVFDGVSPSVPFRGDLPIPSTYNDLPVVLIWESAFWGSELTIVTIPDSVNRIERFAFNRCYKLTNIDIPSSVTYIGEQAFARCPMLTNVTIHDSVWHIGDDAFGYDYNPSITLNKFEIGLARDFGFHQRVTNVIIPDGATSIGDSDYMGMGRLSSIIIPNSVISIGSTAFKNCPKLTSIIIPDSVTSIGSSAFKNCPKLTSIIIPDSVTSIGSSAFAGCDALTSITISDSVTSIADGAFSGCSSLTSITIPEGVTSIGNRAFSGCSSLTSITIPKSVTSIGSSAFAGCDALTSITIPEGVTSIGNRAFSGCSSLTSITIPEGVTSIGNRAFSGCSSLTSITIPEGVTSIGDGAFSGCSLTSITIPNSVTSIGEEAFYDCAYLTSVSIGRAVSLLGDNAFSKCINLSSITFEGNAPFEQYSLTFFSDISSNAVIYYYDSASWFNSPEWQGVQTEIRYADFDINDLDNDGLFDPWEIRFFGNLDQDSSSDFDSDGYTNLQEYNSSTEPDNPYSSPYWRYIHRVLTIETNTDPLRATITGNDNASGNLVIPNNYNGYPVTKIGDSAFYQSSITSITIPYGVTAIETSAFQGCTRLNNIIIPDGLSVIGEYNFANDSLYHHSIDNLNYLVGSGGMNAYLIRASNASGDISIPSQILGSTVTLIADGAFKNCKSLTSITVPEGVTSIGSSAFAGCDALTSITIPDSVTSIGDSAFTGCSSLTSITIHNSVTSFGTPSITAQPSSDHAIIGDTVTLSVSAIGVDLIYQWYKGSSAVAGATSSSYTISNASREDAGSYTVMVSNSSGTVTSDAVLVTIQVTPPSIDAHPISQGAIVGESVVLSVSATGGELIYQWYKGSSEIAGATSSSYTISNASTNDAGAYAVIVSNSSATVTSNTAVVSIQVIAPSIDKQPPAVMALVEDDSIALSVSVFGGDLIYQWYKGGSAITGATSSSYTINNASRNDSGAYTVIVSNTKGSVESSVSKVWVTMLPSIDLQPSGSSVAFADSLTLSVSVSGESLSYQWKKDGVSIGGATSASYVIGIATDRDAGRYHVVVSNNAGSVPSNFASVSVASAPALGVSSNLVSTTSGDNVVLTANGLNGYYNLETVRWYTTGYLSPSLLSFGSSFTIYDVSVDDERTYWFEAETIEGEVVPSESFELTLDSASGLKILVHPTSRSVSSGSTVTLSVSASGEALSYQWYKGSSVIAGATSATYTIGSASEADAGAYSVVVSNSAGSVISNTATLSVEASVTVPGIDTHPTSRSVSSGSTLTLSVSATGNSLSYQWQKGGVAIAGATSASYTLSSVSASDAGAYTVVVSNSAGRVTSNTAALSVEDLSGPGVEVPSIDTQSISQSVTSGDNVTLSVSARGGSLSYQWQTYLPPAGWQDIQGATSSNYTATYNAISDGGAFKVVISNSAGSVASEPVQVLVDDLSKSYTLYGEVAMTWSEAISYAKSQGGYLLEINSYGEWLSIIDFLENSLAAMSVEERDNLLWSSFAFEDSAAYVWLGGSDAAVEGEWRWASSGQFWSGGVDGSAVAGAFNRWGTTTQQNEPDNFEGSQNALALALEAWPWQTGDTDNQLGYAYEWNDLNSQNQLFFIMEQDLDGGGPPLWPSGFSPEAYLALNSDLAAALGSDHNAAWEHYLNYGVSEGRTHSDSFSVDDYLSLNGDLAAAFSGDKKAALEHWFNYGINEGRSALETVSDSWPSGFSPSDYLSRYSDLAAALGSDHNAAWQHYLNYGVTEGRTHSVSFSVDDYLSLNGDLAAVFGSDKKAALAHWFNYGINEGRSALETVSDSWPSGFSPSDYLSRYSDLAAALGSDYNAAWEHYLNYGVTEGRTHSVSFSIDDYLSLNGDLAAAFGSDKKAALEHWFTSGINEGRQALVVVESWPSGFSPSDYLALNSDLAVALGSDHNAAWEHYLNYGVTEGRSHSDSFSIDDYLSLNGDLAAVFGSDKKAALAHWFNYGINEGRSALEAVSDSWPSGFSPSDYLARYSDLAAALGSDHNAAWQHYLNYGVTEGRTHSDSFSVDDYLSLNGDLAAAFGSDKKAALEHWFNYGINEGRQALVVVESWPSGFSPSDYLLRYSDLAAAFGTDYNAAWQHYLNYGVSEGRSHSDSFSVDDYLSLNGDLEAAFGSDKKAALEHWFNYGINEGRQTIKL